MTMLYKFGKRQLPSLGLPEMPTVGLLVLVGTLQWIHGENLGGAHICGVRIWLCSKIAAMGNKMSAPPRLF